MGNDKEGKVAALIAEFRQNLAGLTADTLASGFVHKEKRKLSSAIRLLTSEP